MKKIVLLTLICTSLFSVTEYVPFSEFSKNQKIKNNFIKIEQNNNYKVEEQKQIINTIENIKNENILKDTILKDTIKITTSLSNFNSKSEQYIYSNNGRKISQLSWEAKNVKLFGVGIEYKKNNMRLYANYKMNIKSGDGLMDDYDWVYESSPDTWTHWSHHENTQVQDVKILDLGVNGDYYLDKETKLTTSLGYKWEKQLFKAYDGSYIYSESPSGFRNLEGNFTGIGITYDQEYKGFYLGAELEKKFNNVNFLFNLKYTPWMDVEFTDTHHKRVPAFTDYTSFDQTSMFSFGSEIDYNINSNQMLSFSYEYTKYSKVRGDRVRSYVTGYNWNLPNSVGIESSNDLITVEYVYKFEPK
jgi:outer membrane protease